MADTHTRYRGGEHFSEEDAVDFARGKSDAERTDRLARHVRDGCRRCGETISFWTRVLGLADQEAAYRPPEEVVRIARSRFIPHRPAGLLESVARRIVLIFDSFRQPAPAGVRAAALARPQQLLYKAGRYTIRLRVEPEPGSERMSIVGQILDEQGQAESLRDIAVLALDGSTTLDQTLTNNLGEFSLEPIASDSLQLSVGLPEIGTFTVHAHRWAKERGRSAAGHEGEEPGRGKKARR
jgi:hypothetical protein